MSRRRERGPLARAGHVSIGEILTSRADAEGRTWNEGLTEAWELSAEAVRLQIPATHLAAFVQGYLFARRRGAVLSGKKP